MVPTVLLVMVAKACPGPAHCQSHDEHPAEHVRALWCSHHPILTVRGAAGRPLGAKPDHSLCAAGTDCGHRGSGTGGGEGGARGKAPGASMVAQKAKRRGLLRQVGLGSSGSRERSWCS